jgi:DNA-binding transcriptional LysR family regulator
MLFDLTMPSPPHRRGPHPKAGYLSKSPPSDTAGKQSLGSPIGFSLMHLCLSNAQKYPIDTCSLSIRPTALLPSSSIARLQTFLTVAETLNFRRAAERLGVAQPALSRSVQRLEQHLGFALFERSTRRVALTPAGELLYREAADALQGLSRACMRAERVAQGLSGSIMMGYSTFATAGPMSDIIIAFRKQFPDALVGLRLHASSEQSAALQEGALDLGFIMSTVSLPPLEKIAISRERLVALVPASHRWARRKSISLSQRRWLSEQRGAGGDSDRFSGTWSTRVR